MKREAIASVLVVFALLVCASSARARLERAGHELERLRTAFEIADTTEAQIRGLDATLIAERSRMQAVREIPHALPPGVVVTTALAIAPDGIVLDRFALDVRSETSGARLFRVAIDGFAAEASLPDAYVRALRGSGLAESVVVRAAGEHAVRGRSAFDFTIRFEIPLDRAFELVADDGEREAVAAGESSIEEGRRD